jgi:hypothetical protein
MPITLDGTLGITTPALTVTGASTYTGDISTAGNLVFTSTGDRIIGDFSNATVASRVAFQTSTTNGATRLMVIPNGTSDTSVLNVFNNSDPTNAGLGSIGINAGDIRLTSGITGTGTYLPLTFYTGGSERMRIDTSGRVLVGLSTSGSTASKLQVTGGTTNATSLATAYSDAAVAIVPKSTSGFSLAIASGTSDFPQLQVSANGAAAGALLLQPYGGDVGIGTSSPSANLQVNGSNIRLQGDNSFYSIASTAGSRYGYLQGTSSGLILTADGATYLRFDTNSAERMRIDSSGNVGIGTSSPSALLHVNGTARATSMSLNGLSIGDYALYNGLVTRVGNGAGIGINSANSTDNAYIYFGYGTTSPQQQGAAIGRIGGDQLSLFTASVERLRITPTGSVQLATSGTSILNSSGRPILNQTGSILQVVSVTKTDVFSVTAANFVDVTGLSVSITPSSTSSRILVMAVVNYNATGGGSNGYRLVRNSTPIAIADASGSRPQFSSMNQDGSSAVWIYTSPVTTVDSPATTSAVTYKIQAFSWYGGVWYLNRPNTDRDNSQYDAHTVSSITVMEIAG